MPGQQAFTGWPLLDGFREDAVVPKDKDLEFTESQHSVNNGIHGPRFCLFVHGTDANPDLGQGQLLISNLWLLQMLLSVLLAWIKS